LFSPFGFSSETKLSTGKQGGEKRCFRGDIHIALVEANGNNVGPVSAEIPVGPKWGEIRQTVFGWTTQKFPFGVKTAHTVQIREPHVISVTGKAFYDIGHAPADHSNRRSTPKGYAVWEIHPVMKMEVM
jgi:hypothetical protein